MPHKTDGDNLHHLWKFIHAKAPIKIADNKLFSNTTFILRQLPQLDNLIYSVDRKKISKDEPNH